MTRRRGARRDGRGGQAAVGVLRAARVAVASRCSSGPSSRPATLGALVVLDVKRGDIGSTAQAYADAYLDPSAPMAVDAITASPFLGIGSLDPMFDTAAEARRRRLRAGAHLQPRRARRSSTPAPPSGGTVAGDGARRAARPQRRRRAAGVVRRRGRRDDRRRPARTSTSTGPLLVPGIGAQGGTVESVRPHLRLRRPHCPALQQPRDPRRRPRRPRAARRRPSRERRLRRAGRLMARCRSRGRAALRRRPGAVVELPAWPRCSKRPRGRLLRRADARPEVATWCRRPSAGSGRSTSLDADARRRSRSCRAPRPAELQDEWDTVVFAYEDLVDAVQAAGAPTRRLRRRARGPRGCRAAVAPAARRSPRSSSLLAGHRRGRGDRGPCAPGLRRRPQRLTADPAPPAGRACPTPRCDAHDRLTRFRCRSPRTRRRLRCRQWLCPGSPPNSDRRTSTRRPRRDGSGPRSRTG